MPTRTPCLPDDILLTLSPQVWQQQPQQLLDHLQDLSHLHCCIPKLLSHNPRGLRKLFYRLSRTSKPTAIPFLETLLDLLYSLNPEGTWLQAVGMDFLLTDVKIFTLLAGWFHQRTEIKEWLVSLAVAPQPKRKYRISISEWYLLPAQIPPGVTMQKDERHIPLSPILQPLRVKADAENLPVQKEEKIAPTPADPPETDKVIMISLDGPPARFQYQKISKVKRVRFPEDLGSTEGGKRHQA